MILTVKIFIALCAIRTFNLSRECGEGMIGYNDYLIFRLISLAKRLNWDYVNSPPL